MYVILFVSLSLLSSNVNTVALLFCFTVLMIITGAFVNAPYAMITTAVSADLVGLLACVHD